MRGRFPASFGLLIPSWIGGQLVDVACVVHGNGIDRLRLLFIKDNVRQRLLRQNAYQFRKVGDRWMREPSAGSGLDFHSIVWERLAGTKWRKHTSIPARRLRPRWISEIHSLDPEGGVAIIKIAEETDPTSAQRMAMERMAIELRAELGAKQQPFRGKAIRYSWVEWDMRANQKLRTLQTCTLPTEPFGGWPSTQP